MQAPFSVIPTTLDQIEGSLSPARLERYLDATNGDKQLALRTYAWNARLCSEIYFPLQTAEIVVRNVIHHTLTRRYGAGWYSRKAFIDVLPNRHKEELEHRVFDEQMKRQSVFTVNHVVAALPFGFWCQLLTKNFEPLLWQQGMRRSFPNVPAHYPREELYLRLEKLRRFRNKVAHHYAIFDQHVIREHQNALGIIGWVSHDMQWYVRQMVNPQALMAQRPR